MKTADDRHFRVEREEREKEESFPPHPLYKEQKEQRREFSVSAASRENFRQELTKLGYRPTMKMLPPRIFQFMREKFCI